MAKLIYAQTWYARITLSSGLSFAFRLKASSQMDAMAIIKARTVPTDAEYTVTYSDAAPVKEKVWDDYWFNQPSTIKWLS
jgi:hypothetical protein